MKAEGRRQKGLLSGAAAPSPPVRALLRERTAEVRCLLGVCCARVSCSAGATLAAARAPPPHRATRGHFFSLQAFSLQPQPSASAFSLSLLPSTPSPVPSTDTRSSPPRRSPPRPCPPLSAACGGGASRACRRCASSD